MTVSDRLVVCVLVDAFRHDYLNANETPFLHELSMKGAAARLRPILGYSDSIRATIFTGAYPDEHGYWMEYCYRPGSRAFAPLERLAALDRFPSDFVQRGVKYVLSQSVVRRSARARGYRHLSLRHFPFRSLDRFDWTLKGGMLDSGVFPVPTIFDRLSASGVEWSYLDSSVLGRRKLIDAVETLSVDTRFVFVYLHQIDMASHVFGLESPLFKRTVRKTDDLVREIVTRLARRRGEPELVVFSDHGMSPVDTIVNYRPLLRHPAFPTRFVFALDATMVRVWWEDNDEELRREIRSLITDGSRGRFLDENERRALHLSFDSRLYGDEIFLLEPGQAIFPNFHSMLRPKAMHAYHPDDSNQHGIFLASEAARESGTEAVELVEIAPVIEKLVSRPSRPSSAESMPSGVAD